MIQCRAQVSPGCLDGESEFAWYGHDGGAREDGTWDRVSQTVVCTPCYVKLIPLTPSGQGLNEELAAAIATAKEIA